MNVAAPKAALATSCGVLLGIANPALAKRIVSEIACLETHGHVFVAPSLAQLREISAHFRPRAILLDADLLAEAPLLESLRQFTTFAPVILLAAGEHQSDAARLVAVGSVEVVARVGDFIPLVAGLIERRLRWAEISESALAAPGAEFSEDIGEIFRHEINNPLTGILGNAELLLAHRDRLPAVDTQRLQTVVDLAVRLRETVRRVSNAWDSQAHSLKSA